MKSTIIPSTTFLLITLFLLLLLLYRPRKSTLNSPKTDVLDMKGQPLRTNAMYYILPTTAGRGGGLTMSPKNHTSLCPLYVTQHDEEVYPGYPVWFLSTNPKDKKIFLSTDYNILFNAVNRCLQSAGWQLIQDKVTRKRYIITGGAIGNPGSETVYSWFQIEKVSGGGLYEYKIAFCPTVCPSCMLRCGNLGVFVEDGNILVGVTGRPLAIMFKKA